MIYLVHNTSDEEGYFLLGAFLERDLAIESAKSVDIDCLGNVDDHACVEVIAVDVGMFGSGKSIFRIEWDRKYNDDDDDEHEWEQCY
jgi:hypothetical protein